MAKDDLECSFCGRKKPETNLLIAGLDAHICDRCIEQAHGIVIEESKQMDGGDLSAELMLRKPQQIKAFLDEYIIGQEQTKRVMSVVLLPSQLRQAREYFSIQELPYLLRAALVESSNQQPTHLSTLVMVLVWHCVQALACRIWKCGSSIQQVLLELVR